MMHSNKLLCFLQSEKFHVTSAFHAWQAQHCRTILLLVPFGPLGGPRASWESFKTCFLLGTFVRTISQEQNRRSTSQESFRAPLLCQHLSCLQDWHLLTLFSLRFCQDFRAIAVHLLQQPQEKCPHTSPRHTLCLLLQPGAVFYEWDTPQHTTGYILSWLLF